MALHGGWVDIGELSDAGEEGENYTGVSGDGRVKRLVRLTIHNGDYARQTSGVRRR